MIRLNQGSKVIGRQVEGNILKLARPNQLTAISDASI